MQFITEDTRIYSVDENGKVIAETTYIKNGDTSCINHTFVDPSLRGQGIADKLVSMAVEQIEKSGATVTATCSYAAKWLNKSNS